MEEQEVITSEDGDVITLFINRPAKRNALTQSCLSLLADIFSRLARREKPPVVVLRGSGDEAFSSGYDITALRAISEHNPMPPLEEALNAIETFPFPVLALIKGQALGGGFELAMACDIRIASSSAVMGVPAAKMGLVYPHHGVRRFLRAFGKSRCSEILFTGRKYSGRQCLEMGFVDHVLAEGVVEEFTYSMAREIASNAPISVMGNKKVIGYLCRNPLLTQEQERELHMDFLKSLASSDTAEARDAFLKKRAPVFRGC